MFRRAFEIGRETITLEERAGVYREMADFYETQAIVASLQQGLLIKTDEEPHLTGAGIQELVPINDGRNNHIQFARDSNGLYFARIEGCRYYPIDLSFSESMLEQSRRYRKLAESWFRRNLHAPVFHIEYRSYLFTSTLYRISNSLGREALIFGEAAKELRRIRGELSELLEEVRNYRYEKDKPYMKLERE